MSLEAGSAVSRERPYLFALLDYGDEISDVHAILKTEAYILRLSLIVDLDDASDQPESSASISSQNPIRFKTHPDLSPTPSRLAAESVSVRQ